MVRDANGVIWYTISDGHGSGGGYLSALGWCVPMMLVPHYILLVLLSTFYTLVVI